MSSTPTTARLEARISPELHAMLKRAAEIEGRTVTDYVISTVQAAAQQTIAQVEIISLALADQQAFAQALIDPPPAAPALTRAFERRRKLLGAVDD